MRSEVVMGRKKVRLPISISGSLVSLLDLLHLAELNYCRRNSAMFM